MVPPRPSFTASWFIDGDLVPLVARFFPTRWSARPKKLVMHIDNASPYNSRTTQNFFGHNPLKRILHPAYFPDISPSDFYLFGKVKRALIRQEIPDEADLPEVVAEILNGISDAELQHIFRSSI
jgi:hypothetical protein